MTDVGCEGRRGAQPSRTDDRGTPTGHFGNQLVDVLDLDNIWLNRTPVWGGLHPPAPLPAPPHPARRSDNHPVANQRVESASALIAA